MLELAGPAVALIDEPLHVRVRGLEAAEHDDLLWRARLRDDDGRVWKATAERPEHLAAGLAPSKPGTGPVPALGSLHPVRLDVHVEAADGRGAKRTFERRLLADGARVRRWREPDVRGTLMLPPPAAEPGAAGRALLVDARLPDAGSEDPLRLLSAVVAPLAAAVLASRGDVVLVVGDDLPDLAPALERLAAVPGSENPPRVVRALGAGDVPLLPPGIPVLGETRAQREAREDRWWSIARGGPRSSPDA